MRVCGETKLECSELSECVKVQEVLPTVYVALECKDVAGVRKTAVVARESGLKRAPVARQALVFVEETQSLMLSIKLVLKGMAAAKRVSHGQHEQLMQLKDAVQVHWPGGFDEVVSAMTAFVACETLHLLCAWALLLTLRERPVALWFGQWCCSSSWLLSVEAAKQDQTRTWRA